LYVKVIAAKMISHNRCWRYKFTYLKCQWIFSFLRRFFLCSIKTRLLPDYDVFCSVYICSVSSTWCY